jgi:hypothetical protein
MQEVNIFLGQITESRCHYEIGDGDFVISVFRKGM